MPRDDQSHISRHSARISTDYLAMPLGHTQVHLGRLAIKDIPVYAAAEAAGAGKTEATVRRFMTLPKRVVRAGFTAGGAALGPLPLGSPLVAAENTGSGMGASGNSPYCTAQHAGFSESRESQAGGLLHRHASNVHAPPTL